MKSTIPYILLFSLIASSVFAQQQQPITFSFNRKDKPVKVVDWMYPLTKTDLPNSGNTLDLSFRIVYPDRDFENSDFKLYINNEQVTTAKAGEVKLSKIKRTFEFTISTQLELQPGENLVKARYIPPNSLDTLWSPIKTLVYKNGSIDFDNHPQEVPRPTNYIYWLDPDITTLNNNAVVQMQRELVVKVKIITNQLPLTKDRIVVYHNNNILKTSSKSLLKKLGNDEYVFTEYFQLTEKPNPNFVYIDFKTNQRTYRTKATLKAQFSDKKPNLHVLAIGTDTNLEFTEDDAFDFADLFDDQKGDGKLFNEVNTNILVKNGAAATNIKITIEKFRAKYLNSVIKKNDLLIVFLSSHGFVHNNDLRLQGSDYQPSARESTSVSYRNDILAKLNAIPCKKLIFIDACHSGTAGAKASADDVNHQLQVLNNVKEGTTIISSSQEDQLSYEDEVWQNGAFTEIIVKGLQDGEADILERGNKDGIVTIEELYEYLIKRVPAIVFDIKQEVQRPKMTDNGLKNVAIYIYN